MVANQWTCGAEKSWTNGFDVMNVQFRVDASRQIGSGHMMRCLSLAHTLRDRGASVSFICRPLPGHMCEEIYRQGYVVHLIEGHVPMPEDHWRWVRNTSVQDALATREWAERDAVDWVVVDHYALDSNWERLIRARGFRIMAIDDLADRDHDCDLLLDQNLHPEPSFRRYSDKLPHTCECLFGPRYALLRHQFSHVRMRIIPRSGAVRRILLSFGGVDATNETGKALRGISQLAIEQSIAIDVILGPLSTHYDDVQRTAQKIPGARVHTNVHNMAEFMAEADVSFGAGGTTTWERCCLGLPSFITVVADNQLASVRGLERRGIVCSLGIAQKLTQDDYRRALESARSEELMEMSMKGMALVDGQGCQRVAEHMATKTET